MLRQMKGEAPPEEEKVEEEEEKVEEVEEFEDPITPGIAKEKSLMYMTLVLLWSKSENVAHVEQNRTLLHPLMHSVCTVNEKVWM